MELSTVKDLMTLALMKSVIIKDDTEQLLFQKEIECQISRRYKCDNRNRF